MKLSGRGSQEDGTLSSRYASIAAKEYRDPPRVFYDLIARRLREWKAIANS